MSNGNFVIKWGRPESVTPSVLDDEGFSSTSGSDIPGETAFPLTMLFDAAQAVLRVQPPQVAEPLDETASAFWTGAIRVPVEVQWEKPEVWFKSDLRLFVNKDEGARALLVADLGCETVVREFPYGQKVEAEEFTQSAFHQVKSRPIGHYTASFFLQVERRSPQCAVELRIDSLDVEVNPNFRG